MGGLAVFEDFSSVLSVAKTGMWKVKENLITGESEMYLDEAAQKIFRADPGMSPTELYRYWFKNVSDDYKYVIKNIVENTELEGVNFEKHYVWNVPAEGEIFIRFLGTVMAIEEGSVLYGGILTDISSINNTNGLSYAESKSVERLTYYLHSQNAGLIETLGEIVEFRNMEPGTHIRCVKILTQILANYIANHYPEYGITTNQARLIANASPLHDIGKIAISDMVLLKPGRLTRQEFDLMKTHSELGLEIIDSLMALEEGSYKQYCREIALSHHERYDGRGYPYGLIGDEIPISAQIVSLADVYDSLITPRIYKEAFTTRQAYNMIRQGECGEFNPKLMVALEAVREEFEEVAQKYK